MTPDVDSSTSNRSASWKWTICGLLLLASAINYMDRQTLANASVRITKEFQLTQAQYGNIEAVFAYAFAAGSIVFGWLADRFSVRWLYAGVLTMWSLAGLATGFVHNEQELLWYRMALGFFEAGHWPCAIRTTRALLDARERSLGNSVLQSGTSIGAIITPLIMTGLMTAELGSWRIAFQAVGAVGFAWLVLWFALVKKSDLPAPVKLSATEVEPASESLWSIIFSRRMLVIFFVIACINTTWQILRAWLPKILQEGIGYTESQTLYFTSVWYVATDVGCLGSGALAVWLGRRKLSVHTARVIVFAACGALCATCALTPMLDKGWVLLLVLLLAGAGALGVFPLYHAFTQDLSARHQGKITGIAGVVAWVLPAQAQKLFGALADRTHSFDQGLLLASFLPLIAVLPLWLFWENKSDRIFMNSKLITRRSFLLTSVAAAAASAAPVPARKRIALIATVVFEKSHAQHFIDRFALGYGWGGEWRKPEVDLVSLYIDQFPEKDLARGRSKRYGIPIHKSIADALTLGTGKLAVDGVVIIGEHGDYPENEKGQTLYPRYEFFKEVVKVFESSGRSVPVFNDKHLSTDWKKCVEMVADSKRLDFPFLAGSSLPVTRRLPTIDLPWGTPLSESVCVGYGGVEKYDFHGLETAQCMSERRKGGEVGIKSVLALRGDKMWSHAVDLKQTQRLLLAALSRSHTLPVKEGYPTEAISFDWARRNFPDAYAYFIEHRDGFRTALFMLGVRDFNYAGLNSETGEITSCQMFLPMPTSVATTADFFNPLVQHIERMVIENRAIYPPERTLLTSGMVIAAVESLYRDGKLIETPEMEVRYTVPKESTFWRD